MPTWLLVLFGVIAYFAVNAGITVWYIENVLSGPFPGSPGWSRFQIILHFFLGLPVVLIGIVGFETEDFLRRSKRKLRS